MRERESDRDGKSREKGEMSAQENQADKHYIFNHYIA